MLNETDPDQQLVALLRGLEDLDHLYSPADLAAPQIKQLRASPYIRAIQEACTRYSLFQKINIRRSQFAACYAFSVPKKDDTARLILDPLLNLLEPAIDISCPLPLPEDILQAAGKAKVGCMLDMKSWFTQFKLGAQVAPYFTISAAGATWAYTRVPMGWRLAPALAQRTLLFVLRQAKITSGHVWIDNVILFGQSVSELQQELDRLTQLFHKYAMSFRLEIDIGPLMVDCLGMDLDLTQKVFKFSANFQSKYLASTSESALAGPMQLLDVQRLSGLAVWTAYLSRTPLFVIRPLLQHLGYVSKHRNHRSPLPTQAQDVLRALLPVVTEPHRLCLPDPVPLGIDLYTDSSDHMGGAVMYSNASPKMWQWSWEDPCMHINVKELAALRHALHQVPSHTHSLPGLISWHTDSMVCLGVMQRMYARSPPLLKVLTQIYSLFQQKNLVCKSAYVPTDDNPADFPTRHLLNEDPPEIVPALYGMMSELRV